MKRPPSTEYGIECQKAFVGWLQKTKPNFASPRAEDSGVDTDASVLRWPSDLHEGARRKIAEEVDGL